MKSYSPERKRELVQMVADRSQIARLNDRHLELTDDEATTLWEAACILERLREARP